MKLRGRFTLTLALAALVPIAVAAVVTRQRDRGELPRRLPGDARRSAEAAIEREVERLAAAGRRRGDVAREPRPPVRRRPAARSRQGADGLAARDAARELREQAGPTMRGLSLDVLTITGPDDVVLVLAALPAASIGESEPAEVRERADQRPAAGVLRRATRSSERTPASRPCSSREAARSGRATAATRSRCRGRPPRRPTICSSPCAATGRVDARIVAPNRRGAGAAAAPGLGASSRRTRRSACRCSAPTAQPVAFIEVAVSDGDLDQRAAANITLISAALALGALGAVVLIGLLVARRTARDLDRLVEGSLAAARGDLDHRVPVRAQRRGRRGRERVQLHDGGSARRRRSGS